MNGRERIERVSQSVSQELPTKDLEELIDERGTGYKKPRRGNQLLHESARRKPDRSVLLLLLLFMRRLTGKHSPKRYS